VIPRLATLAWLLLVFLAIVGSLTWAAVVAGLVVAVGVRLVFLPDPPAEGVAAIRPLRAARFLLTFAVQLVVANLQVAWAVLAPRRSPTRPAIVAVAVVPASDTVMATLAGVVSLTPGTLIVDTRDEPPTFYVHVLQFRSSDATALGVLGMQRLLLRAFGPPAAVADVEARIVALEARLAESPPDGRSAP
jgi:multicomponent Na+:H+ antiporter subunit E